MAHELVCGVDVGSLTSEAVLLKGDEIVSYSIVRTTHDSGESARTALDNALRLGGILEKEISFVVATGYGRVIVPFAQKNVSEISCHAKGAHFIFPSARTVLDMGGQDCKAIRCDATGRLVSFVMNDKCAAGTGRAIEVIASLLGVPLEEVGPISQRFAGEVPRISNVCVLFAKSEILSLMREGAPVEGLLLALCQAVADRASILLKRVQVEKDLVITGGIAKNSGVVRAIGERLGIQPLIPPEPQIIGALGAALFARELLARRTKNS
jgi:predicted CoA-substrate-specific enzyme activase